MPLKLGSFHPVSTIMYGSRGLSPFVLCPCVCSRNLLTPMIIHGAWNGSILSLLFALQAAGFDVNALLKDMR